MNIICKLLALFISICFGYYANCQVIISGNITDSISGKPIASVNVICTTPNSSKILKFAITNSNGYFSFSINETGLDSLIIKASHISFKEKTLSIKNLSSQLNLKLISSHKALPNITVRSNLGDIYKRKDTIGYNTDSFTAKNDRVLIDVIKKLPGIEMEGDKILYQGRPLKNFYVDGLNLMGGRYGIITNSLPLEDVKKVQVIENDQPVKILDSLVPSNRASLNVVLKRHKTTGSGNVGAGASPALWDVALTPMSFFKNFQMVNTFQANNTGRSVSNQLKDQINGTQNMDFSQDKYVSVLDAGHPPLDEDLWLQNNVKMASTNMLYKTKNNMQWTGGLTYINDMQKNEGIDKTTIVLPGQTVTVVEDLQNRYLTNNINGIFAAEKNEKSIFFKDQLSFGKKWDDANGLINRDDTSNIYQHENESPSFVSNALSLTTKIGKQLVGIHSTTSYKDMPETLLVSPGQFANVLNNSLSFQQARQYIHFNHFSTDNSLDFIKKINRVTLNFLGGILFETGRLKSQLQTDQNLNLSDLFKNNDKFYHTKIYFNPRFTLAAKSWMFDVNLPASGQLFSSSYNLTKTDTNMLKKLTIEPVFNARFIPNVRWEFSGTVQYNNNFGSQMQWYNGYILTAYNSLNRSLVNVVSQGNTLSYNFYAKYEDVLNAVFANFSVSYSQSYNNFINKTSIDSLGLSNNEMVPIGNNQDLYTASAYFSKYFHHIKTVFKIKGDLNNGFTDQFLNDIFTKIHSTSAGFSLDINNSTFNWVNFDYKLAYNYSTSNYGDTKLSPVTGINHSLQVYLFPVKNQTFSISSNYFTTQPSVQPNKLFMNLKYIITLPKTKTDFSFTLNNILNAKKYITQYTNEYVLYYYQLYLRPRQALFSVRFNF